MTALAESAPGAIAVNAAILVGWQVEGLLGMITAVVGTILPPMVILSIISYFYNVFAANVYVALVLQRDAGRGCGGHLRRCVQYGRQGHCLAFGGIPVFDGSSVCGQLHFLASMWCLSFWPQRCLGLCALRWPAKGRCEDDLLTVISQLFAGGAVQRGRRLRCHAADSQPGCGAAPLDDLAGIHQSDYHCRNDARPDCDQLRHLCGAAHCPLPGAVIATLGCITPALGWSRCWRGCYRRWRDLSVLQSVLACLRPAVVALILGAGLSILGIVVFPNGILGLGSIDWIGTGSFFAAFILLRKYKWNPILTMCLCGARGLGCICWRER